MSTYTYTSYYNFIVTVDGRALHHFSAIESHNVYHEMYTFLRGFFFGRFPDFKGSEDFDYILTCFESYGWDCIDSLKHDNLEIDFGSLLISFLGVKINLQCSGSSQCINIIDDDDDDDDDLPFI